MLLSNKGGLRFYCTCVYASYSFSEHQKLWDLLRDDASSIGSPWPVIGDFNNALNPKDKKGGSPIPFSYLNSFENYLFNYGLVESSLQAANLHGGIEELRLT